MDGLFGFFSMANDYEQRAVARHDDAHSGLIIDTCRITDSAHNYETGIVHPLYNDGKWVIVEVYDTAEEARSGHDKWLKVMTATKLPDRLFDVGTAAVKELAEAFGADYSGGYERQD